MNHRDGPRGPFGFKGHFILFLLCIVSTGMILFAGICRAETVVIDIQYRTAQELLPIVESMLSGEGRVTAHPPTNSLVVTGSPGTIRQVREVLTRLDKPIPQVRVRVRFEEERLERDRAVSGDATVSGDDWKVTTGGRKEDGVEIRVKDRDQHRTQGSEAVLTVMAGTEGYIAVGQDVPVTSRWHRLCRRYHRGCDDPAFRRMETGLHVIPILREDYAILQITPTISSGGLGNAPGAVEFTEAATTVQVPLNRWVRIGGAEQAANEVIREILAAGRREQGLSTTMWLRVEIQMPGSTGGE